ncbi:MAG: hypothetical protein A2V85_02060 [Chloroflexi bacterium RBG_16_72_14]|nr:MAG: hypothetical protein A2V85_02060 [Chloroflexi bacterium RBG_16_72_14]
MSSVLVRRAAVLGLVLTLALSGIALADTVVADGDAVAGDQASIDLGGVAPGAVLPVDVAFRLTCQNSSHVVAGSTITVWAFDQTWPEDGSATVTDGVITVPGTWPAPGTSCPGTGAPTVVGATPAHVVLTAPTVVGADYEFLFLFGADPATGVSNTIMFSAVMDVVEPAPRDTSAPTLSGTPGDLTVFTSGTSAVVTWTDPTATDDTDPNPLVACDPASGSTFDLGTTTVTCTATDASGNAASATFAVTVRLQPAGATWGSPLDGDAMPALVGQLGRTIPLKLSGTGDGQAPVLALQRLATCAADAAVLETRDGGVFDRSEGAWHLNLRTDELAGGCWRLVATVDGAPVATAVIQLVPVAAKVPAKHR